MKMIRVNMTDRMVSAESVSPEYAGWGGQRTRGGRYTAGSTLRMRTLGHRE